MRDFLTQRVRNGFG